MERRPGSWGGDANIQDNMTGYMISYEAYNPETKQNETFTYQATSFLLAQSQMIPIGTPVTITAICNAPYEVSAWSSADAYTAVDLVGSEGNSNQTTANGNSATLTVNSTDYISVTVYAEGLRTVTPPTEEDLINNTDDIFGADNSAVIVDCLNADANHADRTYSLKKDTFTISELQGDSVNGYYVTVTIIDPDAYVTAYNQVFTDVTHERADSDTKTIRLNWEVVEKNGVKESQWKAEEAATLGVTCDDGSTTPTEPPLPDEEDLQKLLNEAVTVKCTNGDNAHDPMYETYSVLKEGYTLGTLQGDEKSGYTVDVTLLNSAYLAAFNEKTGVKHELDPETQENPVITLGYVTDSKEWKVETKTPAIITVTCKVEMPTVPGEEDLQKLLNEAVTVKCTNGDNAHDPMYETYSVLKEGYTLGTLQGDEKSGYTVDVTLLNSAYLAAFNEKTGVKHELDPETQENPVITLGYVTDSKEWKVETKTPVIITVTCKDAVDADIVITPEDLTIYRGGEKTAETGSNVNIVDGDGKQLENDGSLPEIGFSLKLSDELNQRLTNLNAGADDVLDLSGYITLTGKTTDGQTLTWELAPYGEGTSATNTETGYYIYKIVPTSTSDGAKLNVSFRDKEGNYVGTDDFDIQEHGTLAETYTMMIYGDRVDASSLYATITYSDGKTETVSVQGAEKPATLTVRYTNENAPVTQSYNTVEEASETEDGNDQSKLTKSAYLIRGNADSFMVNNSDVQVDDQNVSLLFDDIAETTGTHYADTLKTKAVEAVKASNAGVDTSKLKTEAKYLDLVDATNGNVWVTTDDDVTIYWPFPEGTDASTTFYVAHFDGLDRDKDVSGMTTEVNGATATLMDVKTDQYGVYFTTKKFSPYVLVWDTTKSSGGNGGNGGGGTTTTTTNNNNTNNNTTTVNVTSTAAAQPQAATAAIPQTGDAMPVGLLGGLAAAAAAGFAALFVIRKRKQNG